MNPQLIFVLVLLAGCVAMFVLNRPRMDVVALLALVALPLLRQAEPRLLLATLFTLTALVGMFISNTATAVLMSPIALSVAQSLHASPYPFVMTVALAASAAFMTPVSSAVNTLVLVPGKYRFSDFVRIGVPFTNIAMLLAIGVLPWLLPL